MNKLKTAAIAIAAAIVACYAYERLSAFVGSANETWARP